MDTILDLIGETPLVDVTRLETGFCQLFLKLEAPIRPARSRTVRARDDRGGGSATAG